MIHRRRIDQRVLALAPSTRGFGFAVFEGPSSPVDWGVKHMRENKNEESLRRVRQLIKLYQPSLVVLEDVTGPGSRRSKRITRLIQAIARLAEKQSIETYCYSRSEIRQCFSKDRAFSKHEIAEAIATRFPEFKPRLPPVRKIWMSEDSRMNIFDAVSLIFTFFHFEHKRKRAA